MKILHTVEYYYPSIGGAQEVVKQLSEHMVMLGHDVTVATTLVRNRNKHINGVKIAEFDISGNAVKGYKGRDIEKYKNFLIKGDFDILMNYAAQQWTSDLAFEVLDKVKCKKIFVPCGFSGLNNSLYENYYRKMPSILKKYDRTVYLSYVYQDIKFAHENEVINTTVIPNGAEKKEFEFIDNSDKKIFKQEYGIDTSHRLIITVGNHTGNKGHKETIATFRKSKLTNTTLMIIAGDSNKGKCARNCTLSAWYNRRIESLFVHAGKNILVTEMTRKDVVRAFKACDVFLFLSNIECSPLVIFEAIAAGKPFIASDSGNIKEISGWFNSGLIVESLTRSGGRISPDVKDATLKLEKLFSKSIYNDKAVKARKLWNKKFTWEVITNKYLELYRGK